MEIFTNWLNNLVAKPSFHSLIKKIPIIRRLAFNDGKIIYDLVAGFVYSQVLLAIIELRLIDFLITGKKKIDDISRFTGLPHDKCILLCNAAASVGLLKKNKDSTYRLTRIGAAIKGVSGLDKMILHHKMFYRDLIDPVKLLNKNFNTELRNFWTYVPSNKKITKEEAKTYSELMGISQHIVAEETLNLVDLNPFKSLLDLGGGNGTFILEVRRRYPNLILNVFDLPSVIETAKSKISHLGDKSKIKLIPGNFIEDKLPDGNVLISFSGGRTSGYMLHQILAENGDLPERCKVVFANTGREMPETLDFVQECSERWNVPIVWVEYRNDNKKHDFTTVNHNSASLNGEPFEAIINHYQRLPDKIRRFCTVSLPR